ncbi:MAG: CAP domain-containing protein [Acetobacteraceae bacterium]
MRRHATRAGLRRSGIMRFLIPALFLLCAPAAAQSLSPEAQAMLAAHNQVREKVGVPPLSWSDTLTQAAASWAQHLVETGRFEHESGSPYGENLYAITGATASPAQVVQAWASEAKNYDLSSNQCSGVCGHYTQIVWKGTQRVGCAARRSGGRQVWDCKYDPPGNVVGYRPH